MKKSIFCILLFYRFFNVEGETKENFFKKAKSKYDEKEMEDSKFLFQRNIVFNPKDAKSYRYLAKIYNFEKNERRNLSRYDTNGL